MEFNRMSGHCIHNVERTMKKGILEEPASQGCIAHQKGQKLATRCPKVFKHVAFLSSPSAGFAKNQPTSDAAEEVASYDGGYIYVWYIWRV